MRKGFTLVELLVVVALIALLATLVVPAFNSIMNGQQITSSAQVVIDQLNLARQTAVSMSRTVEVRFVQSVDTLAQQPSYNRVQLSVQEMDGTWKTTSRLESLAPGVAIASDTAYSPLLGNDLVVKGTTTVVEAGKPVVRDYRGFRIGGNGRPQLAGGYQQSFVSLWSARDAATKGVPPPNHVTVQVDPGNATLRVYRP
jgi:uncharacterized protein (TIGR02596 family)